MVGRQVGVAARRVVLRAVSVVDQVDAAQVRVSVVVAGLVARRAGSLGARGTRLLVRIAVGTDNERGVVPVVQAVCHAAACNPHQPHDATCKKGKVFPYSLPSVGPGADPGVQAVSPQVT